MFTDELDIKKEKEKFHATVEEIALANKQRSDSLEKVIRDLPVLHGEILSAIHATHLNVVALARSQLTMVLVLCVCLFMGVVTIVFYLTVPHFTELVKTYVGEIYTWLLVISGSVSALLLRLNNHVFFKTLLKKAANYAESESQN
jgi:hypothetical protein